MPDIGAPDDWKARYRDLLTELERKEQAWQHVEQILRGAASRLGIAAMGRDEQLDGQLQRIVDAVREPGAEAGLAEALEGLSRTVIDQETSGGTSSGVDLAEFVARLPLPPARQRQYLDRLGQGAVDQDRDVLRGIADDVGQILAAGEGDTPGLLDAARRLVGRLQDALPPTSGALRQALGPLAESLGRAQPDPAGVLVELADAVARSISDMDAEKTELESFLEEVTERLTEFESFASASRADAQAREADSESMGEGVASQMHELRDDVVGSEDIGALKERVQSRLDAVQDHIRTFCARESERAAAAEARNAQLTEQINRMRTRTAELARECGDHEQRLMHDTLTGVHTRYAYEQRLQEEFQRWQRHGLPLSFSIWDIDHFKRVNDTYGHQAGDRLLAAVAGILTERTRTEDFLARVGGEEFVLLFIGTPLDPALALA
ncbi:MAG: GGDEF domain-containing protein, partial [Pseudomonadota bacterium]